MAARDPIAKLQTHDIFNQVPPFENFNAFEIDRPLQDALCREGAKWAQSKISAFGELVGSDHVIQLGHLANYHAPELVAFDRYGHRIDEVEYHPAYHELMTLGKQHQVHSIAWTENRPGSHVAHAALIYLLTQAEAGVCCPLAMAYAAIPTLKRQPDIAAQWENALLANEYDHRCIPAVEKKGVTIGMAMTEKQGGSDVRANTTQAKPTAESGPGKSYLLTGHKWFCSAPMSDAFCTIAVSEKGLSCFLVPRWLPDGSRNRFFIQRLKRKLGNQSNASGEIEYQDTWGRMVGEEGQGVQTIIDMVQHTRLDAAASGAGLMRSALCQAIHHTTYRTAFNKRLVDQSLMRNVLSDLALEVEAATILFMRVARAYDEAQHDASAALFQRLATAVTKFWINKRAPSLIYEAMECHGGMGYIEESVMPRLYREAPLNSIWEGSGNVICLDVLRAIKHSPECLEVFFSEIEGAQGNNRYFDSSLDSLKRLLAKKSFEEVRARSICEKMALLLQSALLIQHSLPQVADTFCLTRLGDEWGKVYGSMPSDTNFDLIIKRAFPRLD